MKTKRILISLGIIGVVAAAVVGGTIAYFNDIETSTGNIFTAGSLDLKVDHVAQSYNGVDCQTCQMEIVSDTTNQVVATSGGNDPVAFPHDAEEVTFIHNAWTASIPGATWIWSTDPVTQNDVQNNISYTFRKEFTWFGPLLGATIDFSLGSDNSYEVWLNGVKIDEDTAENNFSTPDNITIDSNDIVQGVNIVEFVVYNFGQPTGSPTSNPAGLLYKLTIDGDCEDSYFLDNCSLFDERDLTDEKFFNFDDVKPGDHGINIISLHVYDNDAWVCLIVHDKEDDDNGLTDPEGEAGDTTGGDGEGELSQFIEVFGWTDNNQNGIYEPGSETELFDGSLADPFVPLKVADSTTESPLTACETYYVGFAWCAGTQIVEGDGTITCDGSTMGDIAQTDSLMASLTAYAEQWRNNSEFDCDEVNLNEEN